MKRLLIITDCFLPRWDGVARFLHSLIFHLDSHFHITVLAPQFTGEMLHLPEHVHVERFPLFPFRFGDIQFAYPDKKRMKYFIDRADIVFTQTIGPLGYYGQKYAYQMKKNTLAFVHSIDWDLATKSLKRFRRTAHFLVKRLAKKAYCRAQVVLCPSKEVAHILQSAGVKTTKKVVSLGIDIDAFAPPVDKAEAKRAVGLNPKHLHIGYHGRIAREKNLPTLVKSFRHLRRDAVELVLVGDGIPDEVNQHDTIHCVGSQNDVVPYLQAMDMYVMPSLLETTSLSTLEAMACGLPVVATPVGRIAEYVTHNVTGLLFARKNVKQLTRHLRRLVDRFDVRKKLGLRARELVLHEFNFAHTAERIHEILHSMA